MMQVKPLLGRVFLPEEAHGGRNNVVILNYAFWQRRFGGDPRILGKQLTIDGSAQTVIGVMPKDFRFAPFWTTHSDFWMLQSFDGLETTAAARLSASLAGCDRAQRSRKLAPRWLRWAYAPSTTFPKPTPTSQSFRCRKKWSATWRWALWILLAAVALVLLIACANVTHLQLMRAAARERETAVRVALGASGGRLIQQTLMESVLVSLAGGLLGLLLAVGGIRVLVALGPDLPRLDTIGIDVRVFAFMLGTRHGGGTSVGRDPGIRGKPDGRQPRAQGRRPRRTERATPARRRPAGDFGVRDGGRTARRGRAGTPLIRGDGRSRPRLRCASGAGR